MIRLLVSDIDGTLVTKEKALTAQVRAAAAALTAHNVQLVLVSSRPTRGVAMFADALQLTTPRAAFNGGVFSDPNGQILLQHLLEEEAAREAVSYLQLHGISPWLFTATEWLVTDEHGDYVDWEQRTVKLQPRAVENLIPFSGQAGKIMAASKDFAKLAACEAALQRSLAGRAAVHRSQDYYLDITHPLANKGQAVREAARLLNIDLAHTACIGDMRNDMPMFDVATYKIAMANAPEEMRGQADYVTASNQESGWAQAVEQYILPNAEGA
jgi:Cof subfamily protein (haloacid dehalogenase superfamily)